MLTSAAAFAKKMGTDAEVRVSPAEAGSGFPKPPYPGLPSWATFVPPFGLDFAAESGRLGR